MKRVSTPGFEAELRISPKPLIILLSLPAIFLALEAWHLPDPPKALNVALLLYALSGATCLLERWNTQFARWGIVIALIIAVHVIHGWLEVPGFLALLALPTALGVAILGLPGATVVVLGETVVLLVGWIGSDIPRSETHIALLTIWGTLGAMYAIYRPVRELAGWSWEHFERARELLDEARDRQAELKDTLDALAHANHQLALTNEKLATMRLIAEEAQRTKAAFVANVSHEFRTPLNMIIGLVDLVMETPEVYGQGLPPDLLEDLEIVHRNCEHLSSMINDVLDLSQIEAGRLALRRSFIDLGATIDRAVAVVRPFLQKKNLSLAVMVPGDLPEVYCDPTRIRQVILNLISNAARFTEEGGITIRVTTEDGQAIVSVVDTGPGIAPEDAERIFEPFQQSSRNLYQQQNGSGLGLSISKRFVEMHGGHMWLESELASGSTFSFKLPFSPLAGPTAPPQRWIAEGWVERTARAEMPVARLDQRVILCDETGELYPLFSRYAEPIEFADTRNLAQAARELEETAAQGVVINASSPKGLWSLIEEASSRLPDMPIIGCSLPPKTEHALIAGAQGYLLKPLTRADLQAAFEALDKPVKRVLVVDDEADACKLLTRMLHAFDNSLEVLTASSGEQALEEMRGKRPDFVLLDIIMPDMDGWQVLKAKAQDEAIRDIPLVIISAQDPQDEPLSSRVVMATMGTGISISKLLRCSGELSALLLQPD